MRNPIAPSIPLAIVLLAVVAAVALRAASNVRRPEPRWRAGTQTPPFTVTADEGPAGYPGSTHEQMQYTFHELHASGRHAVCAVCDSQYSWA